MNLRLLQKKYGFLMFICWLSYTVAYTGRLNYSASLVRIVEDLQISKAEGGMVASFFFFAYGAGQLLNGLFGKRYPLRWAVPISLIGSSIFNVLMTLDLPVHAMKLFWMMNGLFQSILWSTLIRTLGLYMPEERLKRSILLIGTTVAAGTGLTYGISAFNIRFFNWRVSFWLAALMMGIVALIWFFGFAWVRRGLPVAAAQEKSVEARKKKSQTFIITISVLLVFAVLNNLIKDGLTTWTPSIMKELYHFSDTLSILLTLGLPLIAVFGCTFCLKMNQYIRDHVLLCGVFFLISLVSMGVLVVFLPTGLWGITLICFALAAFSMSALNNALTSLVPLQFREEVDCGRLAGVTDAFCYVGSTISTYSLGALADAHGWNGVFYLLIALTLFAILLAALFRVVRLKMIKAK